MGPLQDAPVADDRRGVVLSDGPVVVACLQIVVDEADDGGDVARGCRNPRDRQVVGLQEIRVLDQIADAVSGQPHFGSDDQIGFLPYGLVNCGDDPRRVAVHVPAHGVQLCQGYAHAETFYRVRPRATCTRGQLTTSRIGVDHQRKGRPSADRRPCIDRNKTLMGFLTELFERIRMRTPASGSAFNRGAAAGSRRALRRHASPSSGRHRRVGLAMAGAARPGRPFWCARTAQEPRLCGHCDRDARSRDRRNDRHLQHRQRRVASSPAIRPAGPAGPGVRPGVERRPRRATGSHDRTGRIAGAGPGTSAARRSRPLRDIT